MDKDIDFDDEQMAKMLNLMKIMQMMNSGAKETAKQEFVPIAFDERLSNPEIKVIKAAIPFMEEDVQRRVGIFVKFIEIQKIMELYNDGKEVSLSFRKDNANWRVDMLNSMRPHLNKEKQKTLDAMLKFMSVKDMMDSMDKMGGTRNG